MALKSSGKLPREFEASGHVDAEFLAKVSSMLENMADALETLRRCLDEFRDYTVCCSSYAALPFSCHKKSG